MGACSFIGSHLYGDSRHPRHSLLCELASCRPTDTNSALETSAKKCEDDNEAFDSCDGPTVRWMKMVFFKKLNFNGLQTLLVRTCKVQVPLGQSLLERPRSEGFQTAGNHFERRTLSSTSTEMHRERCPTCGGRGGNVGLACYRRCEEICHVAQRGNAPRRRSHAHPRAAPTLYNAQAGCNAERKLPTTVDETKMRRKSAFAAGR